MPNNHSDVRYVVQHLPVGGAKTKRTMYKVETSIGWKVHIKEQALSVSLNEKDARQKEGNYQVFNVFQNRLSL